MALSVNGQIIINEVNISGNCKVRKIQLKNINTTLNKIREHLEIQEPVTFSTFRHSWASIALDSGISKIDIQKGLGHKDSKTTDNYLKSLDHKSMEKFQNTIDLSGKAKMKMV